MNNNTCIQQVRLVDNMNPTIIACAADLFGIVVNGACQANPSLGTPSAIDNCGSVSYSNNASLPMSGVGTKYIRWTIQDQSMNTGSTCIQRVQLIDNTAPIINGCPTSTQTFSSSCTLTATSYSSVFGITVNDNCDGTSVNVLVNGLGSVTFPGGINTVTYSFIDSSGRISTCSFPVNFTNFISS